MLTIKKASAATGVPEHTLRAWERRYGLFAPTRSPGGYRVYDEAALERIRAMNALVRDGVPPREASVAVLRRDVSWVTEAGGWAAGSDPDSRLVEAAGALDPAGIARVLDEQFARGDFESVVDGWLMPALVAVGRAWASGRISVAGEHLVANAVLRRLATAYEAAGRGNGRPFVIGNPPGVHHELGLMSFAVAARRAGLATLYLGADVPLEAWSDAVRTSGARGVVTSVHRRRDASRAAQVAQLLEAEAPGLPVWVGGRYQHLVPAPARPLGHRIGDAARLLAELPDSPAPAAPGPRADTADQQPTRTTTTELPHTLELS